MFWDTKPSIYLIGIAGSGMSGIAEVLLGTGFEVSGSDLSETATTERLQKLGAKIFRGHKAEHVRGATCVVVSSAVPISNPEWEEANRLKIPVIPRAEMLAELMRLKMGIAVAGSHGKTTTTSLVGQILRPLDPTVVVGGRLQHWDASSIVGRGNAFVIEADESDRSFLKFSPVYSIVTNIDREHLDTYRDLEDIEDTFLQFLNKTAFFGMNWICADCPRLRKIRSKILKPTRTYGFDASADLRIVNETFQKRSSQFSLVWNGRELGPFQIPIVGKHNLQNAAGAIGIALSLGISIEAIQEGCQSFIPADRRLQIHYEDSDHVVVEDYGHHPTEISATLEAINLLFPEHYKKVYFQPHRYSRTQALFEDFAPSFLGKCDELFFLPIYAAHEKEILGISAKTLAESFKNSSERPSKRVSALSQIPKALEILSPNLKKTTEKSQPQLILILGAGPLTALTQEIALNLQIQISKQQRLKV